MALLFASASHHCTSSADTELIAEDGIARRTFDGELDQIRTARHWAVEQLPGGHGHAAAYLTATLVSELATNAVKHTRSGRPGGLFEVDILVGPWVWVAVIDQGGTTVPRPRAAEDLSSEEGRGLAMLAALALAWGHCRYGLGRLVWCSVPLSLGRQR